ncbi:MAG: ERAP1-like C-terminal domain-containing protein [Deltaproteobacteria bacterium]|nr:ERAP1-like C-terminal domain-containing protein [Deltaproteobacteria bacterium]
MVRRLVSILPLLLLAACPPSGDLTVPPPPSVPVAFKVEIPPPLATGRLPDWAKPVAYALRLEIDPGAARFRGDVVIDLALSRPTGAFVLHGAQLDVARAEVISDEQRIVAEAEFRPAAGATGEAEELVLLAAREVPAGNVRLHLEYSAPLDEKLRGIYRVEVDGLPYVFTQLEPSDARRLFPCFDDPRYKVPLDLQVTVPKGNLAFANTPEVSRRPTADGGHTVFTFAPSKPLPTYLVALAVGPLEVREGPAGPVPIRLIATAGKTHLGEAALAAAPELLAIMARYLDTPYPYRKLDLVAVPNFGPGAMENAGLVTFREELLLIDPTKASAKARRDLAMAMAHELSHMWLGNLVTMSWWDDLWLNEGMATYLEAMFVDRWRPSARADLEALSLTGMVMDFDALESARTVRQPVSNTYEAAETFDVITYGKGAAILKMLHRWLGDDPFRAGLRAYVKEHAWGNATSADLFRALGAASNQNVAAVASTFVDQPGVPLIRASLSCERGKPPAVHLSQERYRGGGTRTEVADHPLWTIPVCVEHGARFDGPSVRACTLLDQRSATLPLQTKRCPAWLLPNAGHEGYYRYGLGAKELEALGKAVRQRDAATKVGYVSNLWALVQAGQLPAPKLLDGLAALKKERDRGVIEQIIATLHRVSGALVEDRARPKFESYVAALLMPHARRLGWDQRPGDTEDDRLLRRSVLTALGVLTADRWMAEQARRRVARLAREGDALDADTATIALRIAARRGAEEATFDRLVAMLKTARTPRQRVAIVQGLGSLGDPTQLRRALALVADGTIRAQDALYIVRAAVDWPDSRAVVIEWLQANLAPLAARFPGFGAARMIGAVRRLCDPAERAAAGRAFGTTVQSIPGAARRLREALEAADLCIDLRQRQATAASDHLARRRRW